jgi:hypothetical protein
MEAAKTFGYSLDSAVFATFIKGNNAPQLVSKMECLSGFLTLPLFSKAAHDNSGYFNRVRNYPISTLCFTATRMI